MSHEVFSEPAEMLITGVSAESDWSFDVRPPNAEKRRHPGNMPSQATCRRWRRSGGR
jgi:hypothetical protein